MSQNTLAYSREMAVTHKDFFRILPRAMGAHEFTVEGRTVCANIDQGSVTITLGPEQVRRIALLAIDYCKVDFRFESLEQEQIERFTERFELYYRRGGG